MNNQEWEELWNSQADLWPDLHIGQQVYVVESEWQRRPVQFRVKAAKIVKESRIALQHKVEYANGSTHWIDDEFIHSEKPNLGEIK